MLPKQTCAKTESTVVLVPLILSKFAKVSNVVFQPGSVSKSNSDGCENVLELSCHERINWNDFWFIFVLFFINCRVHKQFLSQWWNV